MGNIEIIKQAVARSIPSNYFEVYNNNLICLFDYKDFDKLYNIGTKIFKLDIETILFIYLDIHKVKIGKEREFIINNIKGNELVTWIINNCNFSVSNVDTFPLDIDQMKCIMTWFFYLYGDMKFAKDFFERITWFPKINTILDFKHALYKNYKSDEFTTRDIDNICGILNGRLLVVFKKEALKFPFTKRTLFYIKNNIKSIKDMDKLDIIKGDMQYYIDTYDYGLNIINVKNILNSNNLKI